MSHWGPRHAPCDAARNGTSPTTHDARRLALKLAIRESSGRPGHGEQTWAASVYQVVVAELARLSGAPRPQGCK
jgi:hypothetical protein